MKESNIFTKTELKELNTRLEGHKKDYRIWYRVKPKLYELFEWFKHKKELQGLVKQKKV